MVSAHRYTTGVLGGRNTTLKDHKEVVAMAPSFAIPLNPSESTHVPFAEATENEDGGEKKRTVAGILLGAVLGFIAWALIYNCIVFGCLRRRRHVPVGAWEEDATQTGALRQQ